MASTADIIAARRRHIQDNAPCVDCGDTLATCKAARGTDPTAPPWFGCCARGADLTPCNHQPDTAAMLALLREIESGTVRTVEEATPKPRARGMSWSDYLDQGEQWKPNGRPHIPITSMDPAWRLNASRFLERNAANIASRYSFSEQLWFAAECASPLGPSESSADWILDDILRSAAERAADPVGWLRATPLYLALVADLPTGDALDDLAERASHWSTCPARTGVVADCDCHRPECEIRSGYPELGPDEPCSCRGPRLRRTED